MSAETSQAQDNTNAEEQTNTLVNQQKENENQEQAAESQNNEQQQSQEQQQEDKEIKEPQIPEKYEFNIPDQMPYDKGMLGEYESLAKEAKLPQDQAQKFLDLAVKNAQTQQKQFIDTVKGWENEIKADSEYGGANLNKTVQSAKDVISKYGDNEVFNLLDRTGLGSNPHILKMLAKIGNRISEDKVIDGNPSVNPTTADKILYPNMKK